MEKNQFLEKFNLSSNEISDNKNSIFDNSLQYMEFIDTIVYDQRKWKNIEKNGTTLMKRAKQIFNQKNFQFNGDVKNPKMARHYHRISTRSESDQAARDRNNRAARISRAKVKELEKICEELERSDHESMLRSRENVIQIVADINRMIKENNLPPVDLEKMWENFNL